MSGPGAPEQPAGPVAGVVARVALAAAVAVLPPPVRARYREEWAADVAGAAEVGLSPRRVALGSLLSALRLRTTTPRGPSAMGTTPPHVRTARRRSRTATAVVGSVVGAAAGALLVLAAVLLAGLWVTDERQLEGTLVVTVPLGAVVGSAIGRAIALRAVRHAPSSGLLPVALGLLGAVGSLALLGSTVPPDVLDAYGVLLLPLAVLLALTLCATAGELMTSRLTPPRGRA